LSAGTDFWAAGGALVVKNRHVMTRRDRRGDGLCLFALVSNLASCAYHFAPGMMPAS